MNPEEQSDLGQYCLQYRLPKNISRRDEHSPAKWSRTVLECSKIILEFSRTMF